MTENELMVRDDVALEAYGDLAEIREMTRRLMVMLPSAKDLGPAGAGALAQASLAMGLNPFIGQIWAIPQGGRNREGTYDTYGIMVGISGLRAKAHEQARADGGMYTVHYRIPRGEEVEGLQINKGDIVRACDLVVSGKRARAHFEFTQEVPRYTGIGVYRNGEKTKMNPLQVARKRAEAEAIKQAFDVPLSFISGPVQTDEIDDVPERYSEYGDGIVNGNAQQAIDEVYGEYVEETRTGDPFLNGDFRGAPMDEGAYADYQEVLEDEAQESAVDLDYVPEGIDEWGDSRWAELRTQAVTYLGYAHDEHVKNTLKKVIPAEDVPTLTYRAAWHVLQEHQRAKEGDN